MTYFADGVQTIPLILEGRDVLGGAQTGTGKTAAFAVPIIQMLNSDISQNRGRSEINALVVTPTRELAIQIDDSFDVYGKYTKIRHTVVFGGVSQHPQVMDLKNGVNVLTATPGR